MPNWIQKEMVDVDQLISNYKTQAQIINLTDKALEAAELSLEDLGATLGDYRTRMKSIIGMRRALNSINTRLTQAVAYRSPNKDGNNVKWADKPRAPATPIKGSRPASKLGTTPNLEHPFLCDI